MVSWLQAHCGISERRGCKTIEQSRNTQKYKKTTDEQTALRLRIKEIAAARIRYGYKRIHTLLRREGWTVNHKRVYRIYLQEGLNLRHKKKRKLVSGNRLPRKNTTTVNQCWVMDFMTDSLLNGNRFRALTIIDVHSRECLDIFADRRINGEKVAETLERICRRRGYPEKIRVDNGPEFISKVLDHGLMRLK